MIIFTIPRISATPVARPNIIYSLSNRRDTSYGENGRKIGRLNENVMNKQLRTADKR
jgi:hypothetical protein